MFINRYICVQDYKSLCVAVVRFVPSSLTSRQTQHTHAHTHTQDRTVTRYITSSANWAKIVIYVPQTDLSLSVCSRLQLYMKHCAITLLCISFLGQHATDPTSTSSPYCGPYLHPFPRFSSPHSTFTPKADGTRGLAESSRRYSRVASIDPASVPTNPPLSCYWHASSRRTDRPARPASSVLYSRPIARILVRNMHHCIGGCIHGAARQSASVWYSPVMTEKI